MYIRELIVAVCSIFIVEVCCARTFDFKAVGSKTIAGDRSSWYDSGKTKSVLFQIKVGSAGKTDDRSIMEIRAATVIRNMANKATGINDVASLRFEPINTSKSIFFVVATGYARSRWQVAGCIIEIYQNNKLVKHWSNMPGSAGRQSLSGKIDQLHVHRDGYVSETDYGFDNPTEIYATTQEGERANLNDILSEFRTDEKDASPSVMQKDLFTPGTKYFVRDPNAVSEDAMRRVLEGQDNSYFYSDDGIVRRDVRSQQDIADFKLMNPKCVVFDSFDELKSFVRIKKLGKNSLKANRASVKGSSGTTIDPTVQAELDYDEDMRRKKLGLPPIIRKRVQKAASVPTVFDAETLNSELTIKSFCGVKFGEVFKGINHCNGRSLTLPQKFRCFTSATRWGSATHNRVARIELQGKVDHLDPDSARQEIEDVAHLMEKKYGVTFSTVASRGRSTVACECSNDELEITISATTGTESTEFRLSFTNKQVESQNEIYDRLAPKTELRLSKEDGADIL